MRNLMLGTVLAGLLAGPAMADVVTLTDGSKREGKVVREDAREVVLQVVQGRLSAEITFKREEVRSIEKGPTAAEKSLAEVERRRSALGDKDAAGWAEYARWLDRQPGFSRDAREAWERVLGLEPENAAARERLGYRKVDGKWLTEAEAMAARGLILRDGRWVKPDAAGTSGGSGPDAGAGAGTGEKLEDIRIALADEIRKQRAKEEAEAQARRLAEWRAEMTERAARAAAATSPAASIQSGGPVFGPYGYGYYGVTTSDGQYMPFVPYSGQGVVYYDGVWLGGCGPVILQQQGTTTTTRSSYGFGFEYTDKHWKIRFGGR